MNKKYLKFSKHFFAGISILIFSLISIATSESESDKSKTESKSVENTQKNNWTYSEDTDKMEGTKIFYASTTSTNTVEFDFPYDGGSNFGIVVRNYEGKNEVLISVSKGQFMTSIGGSESVKVKFDDEKPELYSYNSAADASSDLIFLINSSKFIEKLKTAKTVMIETTFFNSGSQIMEFNVDDFHWEK